MKVEMRVLGMCKNRLSRENIKFFVVLFIFGVLSIIYYFDGAMIEQNTTLYAFSYKYGFISRGFLGTIWQWLDANTSLILMSYHSIYQFSELALAAFFILLMWFYIVVMKRCSVENQKMMRYLIVFFSVFNFPMFAGKHNFGRVDIFLVMITIICCICLVEEKLEWSIPLLCFVAELLHQGFVFMNINIILVLIMIKALDAEGKRRKKYMALLLVTFCVASVMFLYFEIFSSFQDTSVAGEIIDVAKSLSADGKSYSTSLINHEILKKDVFEEEWKYHLICYIETPIFAVLFFPYILIFVKFFKRLLTNVKGDKINTYKYWIVLLGAVTVVPEIVLKTDYGRYLYAIIFYYVGIVICLIAMGDRIIITTMKTTMLKVKEKIPIAEILVAYPLIYMPFYDVYICKAMEKFVYNIFGL